MYYCDGKYSDAGISINYDDDENCQGYTQSNAVFGASTKDDILQSYISDHDFRSSNVRADSDGYNFYVFDVRCQKNQQLANQLQ